LSSTFMPMRSRHQIEHHVELEERGAGARAIVRDDEATVVREPDVRLNLVAAQVNGGLECGDRVLGGVGGGSAVGDPSHAVIVARPASGERSANALFDGRKRSASSPPGAARTAWPTVGTAVPST
jgi:hypothetical protein